ncbi:WcaI family glycosyltransferase [Bradyrhizobium sp.]|uniref:WcaI family glycosyltransferase n=1 Tax=Bradyrhizobium sp. TaxID=376 RepID=UPI001EB76101|nr:WcaI family glycosyltransferase [Bradyrhizobium sp.]MBV8922478.1 WcaI family glycosyltransferase [Bradyrhizobium sp.]MBV9981194.1 WcaI family glycosyltransferase [Bradyrhizobium sp.]
MRVLVIGINYAPDLIGVAKYNTELCESLRARGHAVRVVTAPPYYPDWTIPHHYRSLWYSYQRLDGVDIIRSPIYVPRRPTGMKRLVHHASFLLSATVPALWSALRWRPDIIVAVAPSLLAAPIAALAARATGAASWLHVQDLEVDAAFELGLLAKDAKARDLMLALERRIFGLFDRVSTISPQMLRSLQHKGLAPEKLREFPNWVDTSVIVPGSNQTELRANLGLKPTDVVALYAGAMSNKQGLELIVEAAGMTRRSHPALQFVLCGNGPMRPELTQMARKLPNLRFLDLQPLDRLPELLNTADIHLLPQRAQITDLVLPSKLAGMLASGRPIIAMAAPGSGVALETEGAGRVISPGNAEALAAAVIALADDEALRERLGTAARKRAEQKWDRSAIIRAIELELLAMRQPTAAPPRPRQPAYFGRSIDQIATGSRRAREDRLPARQVRTHSGGVRTGNE